MKSIVDKKRENLHQVACLRLFETVHPGSVSENVGNHPNGFFTSSVAYLKDVEKKNKKQSTGVAEAPTEQEAVVVTEDVEMK